MRRLVALFFLVFSLVGTVVAQQMTDDQVVQYVKSAQQTGKTQKEIATELMRRGVTKELIERIREKYESEQSGQKTANGKENERSRQRKSQSQMNDNVRGIRATDRISQAQLVEQNDSIEEDFTASCFIIIRKKTSIFFKFFESAFNSAIVLMAFSDNMYISGFFISKPLLSKKGIKYS